jgi:5-formyltetrahydrofolate cyclo-ligase
MKNADIISLAKTQLRHQIYEEKRKIGLETLQHISSTIISRLETNISFQSARHILAYCSLPFEVETTQAIDRWMMTKQIYLPVVVGSELKIKRYLGANAMVQGSFNVWEPMGEFVESFDLIDLVIIPGVAFDIQKKRIGYGKGFYDKLLPKIEAQKVGICFDFQLLEQIPTNDFDQSVDLILTEKRLVL